MYGVPLSVVSRLCVHHRRSNGVGSGENGRADGPVAQVVSAAVSTVAAEVLSSRAPFAGWIENGCRYGHAEEAPLSLLPNK
ncbi:hypothetical protein SAMD00023353_4700870 [Rosellinia necatrix]|uniref:Uncharacterized protein n=1 Tax=Rosellinia necatrix TaxID=77044 RepID=A0A1S8A9L2_ROSNE|nr:hypothetical protein SAMD00023353_4700870 [Rosellinia necatrix]